MNNKRNIQFLSAKEVRQIIDAIPLDGLRNRRDRAILEVLFSTGLRISELLSLKRSDLLKGSPRETLELSIIGKMQWQRTIYISPVALQATLRYFAGRNDDNDLCFPIGIRQVQNMVKTRARKAGLDKIISPHGYRHSFAVNLLKQGVNIFYVKEYLGHRSLSSTQQYLHVSNSDLKKIHEKLYK